MFSFKQVRKSTPNKFWVYYNCLRIGVAQVDVGVTICIDTGGQHYSDSLYTVEFRNELVKYCKNEFDPDDIVISYQDITALSKVVYDVLSEIFDNMITDKVSLN